MKKLLIAVNSKVICQELNQQLSDSFQIFCCQSGTDALYHLMEFRPDILVIDLMLSELDGISVIKSSAAAGIYPQVIALSDYVSSYIATALEQLDVCCLLRCGTDLGAIASRIMEFSDCSEKSYSVESCIRDFIAMLGFRMKSGGASVTEIALQIYAKNPKQTLSHDLYPMVAKIYGSTPTQVERAIRTSIESAWLRRNEDLWRLYFAVGKNGMVSKPTNADFLARAFRCIDNLSHYTVAKNSKKTG